LIFFEERAMVYVKTESGRAAVQSRASGLTPGQRRVLILCDGERERADLLAMMPPATLELALQELCAQGLLEERLPPPPPPRAEPVPLTEAERFRAVVELATSMAVDLGFASRIKAQLQIEKAQSVTDLSGVVDLLYKDLSSQGKKTPLLGQRLARLRELAQAPIAG